MNEVFVPRPPRPPLRPRGVNPPRPPRGPPLLPPPRPPRKPPRPPRSPPRPPRKPPPPRPRGVKSTTAQHITPFSINFSSAKTCTKQTYCTNTCFQPVDCRCQDSCRLTGVHRDCEQAKAIVEKCSVAAISPMGDKMSAILVVCQCH